MCEDMTAAEEHAMFLSVECPRCGAKPKQECRNLARPELETGPHAPRCSEGEHAFHMRTGVITKRTRVVVESGVWLDDPGSPEIVVEGRTYRKEIPSVGRVFVAMSDLENLADQGTWDSQFGKVLLWNDPPAERALEAIGWLSRETKGGVHGTDEFKEWFKKAVW